MVVRGLTPKEDLWWREPFSRKGNILITTKFYKFLLVKLISLNSESLLKILYRLNTQIKLILVGNHTEVST